MEDFLDMSRGNISSSAGRLIRWPTRPTTRISRAKVTVLPLGDGVWVEGGDKMGIFSALIH